MKNILVTITILLLPLTAPAQEASPPFFLPHRDAPYPVGIARSASPPILTVPAETEITVELLSGIHTQVNHEEDAIKARLLQPLYVDGRVALPLGTLLDGRIIRIRTARRLNRPAELHLRFERITLPDGRAEPVTAVLAALENPGLSKISLDPEGYLKGSRAFSWKRIAVGITALGALATTQATFAGTAALAPILPVSGAALLTYAMVWPRGNDVHLPPQTHCRLRLSYPLAVRIPG